MAPDPNQWLLGFTLSNGKPWGTGTHMAGRAATAGAVPWDTNCAATPIIGGYNAMVAIREALETVIANASVSTAAPGARGHVYIAGWRISSQRDLSSENQWKTGPWTAGQKAVKDQTLIGLILRLMQAGLAVRILIWIPTPVQSVPAGLGGHVEDHHYLAEIVTAENARLANQNPKPTVPLGIVGLDARTAGGVVSGAHHQKMMVIRSPQLNVAFCGGVDLTFTRRDAPADPATFNPTPAAFLAGDWQSGTMPDLTQAFPPGKTIWPPDNNVTAYDSVANVKPPTTKLPFDMPANTNVQAVCDAMGGKWDKGSQTCTYTAANGAAGTLQPIYGPSNQIWHDQHLQLTGPIVSTLEWQFVERWIDSAPPNLLGYLDWRDTVLFSSDDAVNKNTDPKSIVPLATPIDEPAAAAGTSTIQMWRTIPMRNSRTSTLFGDGEFTVMAGYAKAIGAAKELIWIFDQYFWSEPVTRLLNYRVRTTQNDNPTKDVAGASNVCVIVILPPYGDDHYLQIHRARHFALDALIEGLNANQMARVAVYDLWQPSGGQAAQGRGIYVHAKTQTYDGSLLVCGSANMNRRSLTCDSELSCAVLDPAVVVAHQKNLWQLLFGNVTGALGAWPDLDLDTVGNGATFVQKFRDAASASGSFVVPDPWNDANPVLPSPKPVALPNGVLRPEASTGPMFDAFYGAVMDPGSLDPVVEQDVVVASAAARPARLDDIVNRVENVYKDLGNGSFRFPYRKTAPLPTGALLRWPGIVYSDAKGYSYTENAEWWKELCLAFPCFSALQWPGYATKVTEAQIDGQAVVIQLWKGWCQKFASFDNMPGGVGAEVGVYRRIPGKVKPPSLPRQLGSLGDAIVKGIANLADSDLWWPFPELAAQITFKYRNPTPTGGDIVFEMGEEDTWWACKWMKMDSFNQYQGQHPQHPAGYTDYVLDYTVTGQTSSYSEVW